jgi:hypothetical protein
MFTGSCHCGAVRFEITGEIRRFQHCHCHTCRRIHGTVYGSSAVTDREGFTLTQGAEAITEYESSPGKKRCFCSRCGSHVYAYRDAEPRFVVLRMGTVHGDPGVRPTRHIWVSQKAPWYEIHDDLPQLEEM